MSLVRQVAFFGIIGVLATFVHVALAYTLMTFLALNPYFANALGAAAALGISFLGNSQITFLYRGNVSRAFVRFLVQSALSFALTNAVVFVVEQNGWPSWLYAAIVIAVVPPVSFVVAKLWVYRSDSDELSS